MNRTIVTTGRGALGVLVAVLALAVSACGNSDGGGSNGSKLADLKQKGVARLGVAQVLPEAGAEGGKPLGIAPELTEEVLSRLGVKQVKPVVGEFASVIPSLQAGRVDLGTTLMYITPERCKAVLFSDPPLVFQEAMAVKKGNPLGIRTYEDVAKKNAKLGLVSASFELDLAEKAGISDGKIQKFPDLPSMLDALKAGRIDAAGYDDVTIAYFIKQPAYQSALASTVPYAPAGISGGAIAFPKNAPELRDAFNRVQRKMLASGELNQIFAKWGVPRKSIDLARGRTANDFCTPSE